MSKRKVTRREEGNQEEENERKKKKKRKKTKKKRCSPYDYIAGIAGICWDTDPRVALLIAIASLGRTPPRSRCRGDAQPRPAMQGAIPLGYGVATSFYTPSQGPAGYIWLPAAARWPRAHDQGAVKYMT